MLAMLSCVFNEPAAGEGSAHAMTELEENVSSKFSDNLLVIDSD